MMPPNTKPRQLRPYPDAYIERAFCLMEDMEPASLMTQVPLKGEPEPIQAEKGDLPEPPAPRRQPKPERAPAQRKARTILFGGKAL